jgi:hypothetical protein
MGRCIGVARPPFPKTLRQFQIDFATVEACQQYLAACRWPDGFTCPRCGHKRAYEIGEPEAPPVHKMPAPGFVDIRDSPSQDQGSTDPLVLGSVSDDH